MAVFTCYVPTNTFGKGSPPPFGLSAGDASFFELDSSQFYQLFGGSFGYYSVIAHPYDGGTGSSVSASVRRMASRSPILRRRAVSMTERMSA